MRTVESGYSSHARAWICESLPCPILRKRERSQEQDLRQVWHATLAQTLADRVYADIQPTNAGRLDVLQPAAAIMSGACLEDLPQELLLNILRGVVEEGTRGRERNHAFRKLCLIRPLHAAATELLYEHGICEHVVFDDEKPYLVSYCIDYAFFLRTMLQHPELGALVRTISLGVAFNFKKTSERPNFGIYQDAIRKMSVTEDLEKILLRALKSPNGPYGSRWEAFAVMALFYCPNVKAATLVARNGKKLGSWWEIALPRPDMSIGATVASHANLKSLDLLICRSPRISAVAGVFRINTLENLTIRGDFRDRGTRTPLSDEADHFTEGTSNIRSLRLLVAITPRVLTVLLRCCKSLQSFVFGTPLFNRLAPDELHTALQRHRGSLCKLKLFNLSSTSSPTGTWSNFYTVETFYINAEGLYGTDVSWSDSPKLSELVPQNVAHLGITDLPERDEEIEHLGAELFLEKGGLLDELLNERELPQLRSLCTYGEYEHKDGGGLVPAFENQNTTVQFHSGCNWAGENYEKGKLYF